MSKLWTKTTIIRIVSVLVVLLFAVMLFLIGKQHTILLDNKAITVNGVEYPAMKIVEVRVNKTPSLELYPRDRDKVDVTRQKHTITVSYTDDNWNDISITRTFKVPLMEEMSIISLPALVGNPEAPQSVWMERYELPTFAVQALAEDEEIVTDELAGLLSE